MSSKGISALERGERRTPQRETLALLAGALALNEEQRQEFEVAAARSGLPRRLGPALVTVGPWADRTNSNLPFALKSFVGREEEVDEITALVRELGSLRSPVSVVRVRRRRHYRSDAR